MRLTATNLRMECPRCGRLGVVSIDRSIEDSIWFQVDWEPRAKARRGVHRPMKACRDTGLDIRDLLNPLFGCGYDSPQRHNEELDS
jgi:hypothetical protein